MRLRSISVTLALAFLAVAGVAAVGATVPLAGLHDAEDRFATVFADRVVPLQQLGDIRYRVDRLRAPVATGRAEDGSDGAAIVTGAADRIDSIWVAYLATYLTPEEAALVDRIRESVPALLASATAARDAWAAADTLTATEQATVFAANAETTLPVLTDLIDLQVRVARGEFDAVVASAERSNVLSLLAIAGAVVGGLLLAFFVGRSLTRALADVQRRAESLSGHCIAGLRGGIEALADGRTDVEVLPVTTPIDSARRDELGDLARTVDVMIGDVQGAVAAYGTTRHAVRDLAAEIRQLGTSIADGALDARGDAARFRGDFAAALTSVNGALDEIVVPLSEATDELRATIHRLQSGDLTARPDASRGGVNAAVLRELGEAIAQLEETVTAVKAATQEVSGASAEIATAAEQGSQGASQQAAGLEEVAASTAELRGDAEEIAQGAAAAHEAARKVGVATREGTTELGALAASLAAMKERAEATSRVVQAIDEIAFQTNILALNAAVEAARAGDAGRGFAVVADEVRALAMRAAESARQAGTLITENVEAVEAGVQTGNRAVAGITGIDTHVGQLTEIMDRVAGRSRQQQGHVSQIAEAIESLNQLTQRAAAGAEETAAAAEELRGQSDSLRGLADRFRVGAETAPRGGARRPAGPPVRGAEPARELVGV